MRIQRDLTPEQKARYCNICARTMVVLPTGTGTGSQPIQLYAKGKRVYQPRSRRARGKTHIIFSHTSISEP